MRTNQNTRTLMSGLCALLTVLLVAGGCGKDNHPGHNDPAKEAACGDHGADDGHGHDVKSSAATSASLEERVSAPCECGVPTYQCAECRYEVGVVKVDASLRKREDGGGLVRTQAVVRTPLSVALPVTGEVALNENTAVHISPRVGGIIVSVSADIGARVKPGDTLLTLASAELGRALADYERHRTLSDLSARILARETRLRDRKIGSEQDLIEAQMSHEQHRTELKASEQALHVLGVTDEDLAVLRERPQDAAAGSLPVRAPAAGTIIEKHAVAGEMVEAGKDLMLLADLSTVWVWANVHSRDLAPLLAAEKRGPVAVEITVSAFPDRRFAGTLDYVGATMNEQTRTIKVRATVRNPDRELRPGMFCDAAILLGNGQAEDVLAVPRAAVLSDEGASFVFKHWKDDFFVRQNVRGGRAFHDNVEIVEGLQAGDVVVAEGAFLLKSDVLREKMGAGCAD